MATHPLEEAYESISKAYSKNTVFRFTDHKSLDRECLSSGSIGLDEALGGGFVKGRLIELFGSESSGKTTLALQTAVEAQKQNNVLFLDVEHSFDPNYAKALGVDLDKLWFCQPDYCEQAFDIIEAFVETGEISLVVLDSIASLCPKAELLGDPGDANMGVAAKLMSQHLRKVIPVASKKDCVLLYLNQIRYQMGFFTGMTTPGAKAVKFLASVRLDIRQKEKLGTEDKTTGIRSKVKVVKNKTYPPFKEAEFNIVFGKGIDREKEIVEYALRNNKIVKSGSWYEVFGEKIQGLENLTAYLKENNKLEELYKKET